MFKSTETESKIAVPRGWKDGEWGVLVFNECTVSVGEDEKVLEMHGIDH